MENLSEETSGEIIPRGDGSGGESLKLLTSLVPQRELEETQSGRLSSGNIKVYRIDDFKEVFEMLIWIFGTKSMECASALHQPDGVGLQGSDIGSLSELNGVSIALVARTGVFS